MKSCLRYAQFPAALSHGLLRDLVKRNVVCVQHLQKFPVNQCALLAEHYWYLETSYSTP
jgi:hypothetical protein